MEEKVPDTFLFPRMLGLNPSTQRGRLRKLGLRKTS